MVSVPLYGGDKDLIACDRGYDVVVVQLRPGRRTEDKSEVEKDLLCARA
jgi:hypothetical protein